MTQQTCPECRAGKHTNCTGWALDDLDREIDCPCECQSPTPDDRKAGK